jgi:hypothetical protein
VGNGGSGARYWWTQTLRETTAHVLLRLPQGLLAPGQRLRAKDLCVAVVPASARPVPTAGTEANTAEALRRAGLGDALAAHAGTQRLRITVAAGSGSPHCVVDAVLHQAVRASAVDWALEAVEPGAEAERIASAARPFDAIVEAAERRAAETSSPTVFYGLVTVSLEKVVETWWRRLCDPDAPTSDPAAPTPDPAAPTSEAIHPFIDATLVDSTAKVADYDAETQAAIRKAMHEQRERMASGALQREMERARSYRTDPGGLEGADEGGESDAAD